MHLLKKQQGAQTQKHFWQVIMGGDIQQTISDPEGHEGKLLGKLRHLKVARYVGELRKTHEGPHKTLLRKGLRKPSAFILVLFLSSDHAQLISEGILWHRKSQQILGEGYFFKCTNFNNNNKIKGIQITRKHY